MAEEDDSHTLEVLATLKDTPAAMLSRGIIKKNACVCQYDYATHLVEILVMKGSFWKNMGFSSKGKNYLYPEEALYLFELDRLCIQSVDGKEMTVKSVFSTAVGSSELSLASYLVFTKLKVMLHCLSLLAFYNF